jgi:hypothetical protein
MKYVKFLDPEFGTDITEETNDFLSTIHSSKIIRVSDGCERDFGIYRIQYSYQTRRGNHRTQEKFFLIPNSYENGFVRARKEFSKWCSCFNTDNPFRRIGKVKIDSIEEVAVGKMCA